MITKAFLSPKSNLNLICLIDRCFYIKSFKEIHALLITCGIIQDNLVKTKIIDFFGRSGNLQYAYLFLHQIHWPITSFSFNSLISAYAGSKTPKLAILVYKRILGDGFSPDMYTFPVVLKSCAKILGTREGKQVHGVVVKMGFLCDLYVQNALVHFYGVCGECECASKLFDEMPVRDVVSWTSLISGYVRGGSFHKAVNLFLKMDVNANAATLVSALVASGRLGDRKMGEVLHGIICKREFRLGNLVIGNALMDMYVKCECLDDAKRVFDEIPLPLKDIVSWTCVISGLVQCKRPKEALELFHVMQVSGVEPDKVVLATVLSACASLGALDYGRWVHEYIDRKGIEWDAHIGSAMVDMYAKCGCLDTALQTFHGIYDKNIYSWNALLGGLAMHGHGKEALHYFIRMVEIGMRPNEVTFLAILTSCCHSGLVEEGRRYFDHMTKFYNLTPKIEHYGCMVDLLGRAGLLSEAQDLIRSMPMQPDVLIWGAMLSACKAHGDVKLSQQILGKLLEFESHDSGVYVLQSNIYATNDRWEDATKLRSLMKAKGIKKAPGSSVLEVNGQTHEFLAGDNDHSHHGAIYLMLDMLMKFVNLEGYASEEIG